MYLASTGNLLKLRQISIEDIRITTPGSCVIVLPNSIIAPAIGQRAHGAGISRNHKRRLAAERAIVSSTQLPPACRSVDERILRSSGVISVDKVVNPADHGTGAQTVAAVPAGGILEIQHSRQSDAIR